MRIFLLIVLRTAYSEQDKQIKISDTIQALQKDLRDNLDTNTEKYEKMVDYYDNVLRERASDLQDLQTQVVQSGVTWSLI